MADTRMTLFEVKSHTYEHSLCSIWWSCFRSHFVDEGLIHEIWSANTQIQYVHFLHDSVIECIEKPRSVGDLNDPCVSENDDRWKRFLHDYWWTLWICVIPLRVRCQDILYYCQSRQQRISRGQSLRKNKIPVIASRADVDVLSWSFFSSVQLVTSAMFGKCGCPSWMPVSKTATWIPAPRWMVNTHERQTSKTTSMTHFP